MQCKKCGYRLWNLPSRVISLTIDRNSRTMNLKGRARTVTFDGAFVIGASQLLLEVAQMTSSDQPTTPPWQPGPLGVPSRPSRWPTFVGVIAIVLAALGILGRCWAIISPPFMEMMAQATPLGRATGLDILEKWRTWVVLSQAFAICLAVLLLVSGVGLLQRRRWAIKAGRLWAILKILFVAVGIASTVPTLGERFADAGGGPLIMGEMVVAVYALVFIVLEMLLGCAVPMFLLIWFNRFPIETEIAEWR